MASDFLATIATIEQLIERPFQRVLCFFHHQEKSFEVVFLLYSGHSTSPGTYKDGVGRDIKVDVHKLTVVKFTVLPNSSLLNLDSISGETFRRLSTNHQVLISLVRIIITGEVDTRWSSRKIGPVVASRFTTTQARTLRLYISQDSPSYGLNRVVTYLIYVWAEVFILSLHKNLLTEAPRLLLLEVLLTKKHCTMPEQVLLKSSISCNGQMGHQENVLLAMLASPCREERTKAVEVIFQVREQGPRASGIRPFKVTGRLYIGKNRHIFFFFRGVTMRSTCRPRASSLSTRCG